VSPVLAGALGYVLGFLSVVGMMLLAVRHSRKVRTVMIDDDDQVSAKVAAQVAYENSLRAARRAREHPPRATHTT
jgi:hypothetical protein